MSLLNRLLGRRETRATETSAEPLLVNAYATVRDLPPPDFGCEVVGARDLSDPELAAHLDGFIGYVMSRGDGAMTATRYHLWRHLQRVRHHLSLVVPSGDMAPLTAWAQAANAVLFLPDGSVRAPGMAVILSADGESDPSAALPYPTDAVARRARTRERLRDVHPQPPASMPPSLGTVEVVLRPPADVLARALALFFVAAQGQAVGSGRDPIEAGQPSRNRIGHETLSPAETAFVEDAGRDDDKEMAIAAAMTWRYEAANTLLWALGFDDADMARSDRMIDVDALWRSVSSFAGEGQGETRPDVRLRDAGDILDALDRTWLEHWAIRQARQADTTVPALNGDIVMERHLALNWLTGFHNDRDTAWDDIDTPT